jgi:hypothetical protein
MTLGLLTRWYSHKNVTRGYLRELHDGFKDILNTRPLPCTPDAAVELHTVTSHAHLFMYLTALKSLLRFEPNVAVVAHDGDGDVTADDVRILTAHIPGIRVIDRKRADAQMRGFLADHPVCADYRSRVVNSLELLDNLLLSRTDAVMTMNSDVLFLKSPEQLIAWLRDTTGTIIYVHEDRPASQQEFLDDLGCGFPPHVTLALVCLHKSIADLDLIELTLERTRYLTSRLWAIGQCAYPVLLEAASRTYTITTFDKATFDASGSFREAAAFRHYWSSTGLFTDIHLADAKRVIDQLKHDTGPVRTRTATASGATTATP